MHYCEFAKNTAVKRLFDYEKFMLNESQKNKFTARTKEITQNLLKELNITKLDDNSDCDLESELD